MNLSTEYLGLKLKNPIIVSSSGLTHTIKGVKKCVESGAGAVVLKSLFEEQVSADTEHENPAAYIHPDAGAYSNGMAMRLGPDKYLSLIEEAKSKFDIPIIASLNCIEGKWWHSYAKRIQNVGADAIELNIAIMPRNLKDDSVSIEKRYLKIVDKIRQLIDIPIAVKIGPCFSSLPKFTVDLKKSGATGLVLFNRFFSYDINIHTEELVPGSKFSHQEELAQALRWIAILHGDVDLDFAASTGIHTADGVIKALLAGANATQICSTVYQNGFDVIPKILKGLEKWMVEKRYSSIADFQGKLSMNNTEDPEKYERLQYIKALTGVN